MSPGSASSRTRSFDWPLWLGLAWGASAAALDAAPAPFLAPTGGLQAAANAAFLTPFLQAQVDEAQCRQLAWQLGRLRAEALPTTTPADLAAEAWQSAAPAERALLLQAASRAWRDRPELAELAALGIEAGMAEAWSAAERAGDSPGLDQELRRRLAAQLQPDPRLIRASWLRGAWPAELQPEGARALADAGRAALADGRLPRRSWAAAAELLEDPRPLLLALCGRSLPDAEIVSFRRLEASAWDATDRLLLELILLDHGAAADPGGVTGRLWQAYLEEGAGEADAALASGFLRHALGLPRSLRGDQPLLSYPPGRARDWLLAAAPLGLSQDLLFEAVLNARAPAALRRASAIRLLRADGLTMAPQLFPMLREPLPEELAEILLVGCGPMLGPELAELLEQRPQRFRGAAAAPELELLLRHGDPARRVERTVACFQLPETVRYRVAKAGWEAGPAPGLERLYRSWTEAEDRDHQDLARRLLRFALPEDEVAACYRERLAEEDRPEVRERLLDAVRELRSDAALQLFVDWLDSPEGRAHPECAARAFLVVPEAAAEAMFRRWWQERDRLTPGMVDAAAAALAAQDPAAREHVYRRLPELPRGQQMALADHLRHGAGPADHQRWRDAVLDAGTSPTVRRAFANDLGKDLPNSAEVVDELFQLLAGQARMGRLPQAPWGDLVEAVLYYDAPEDRRERIALLRHAEADLGPAGLPLRISRLRGMARNGLPEEVSSLIDELLEGMPADAELPAPAAARPHVQGLRQAEAALSTTLIALGGHGEAGDRALADALEAAGPECASWLPERLWLLREAEPDRLPLASAAAARLLDLLEAPSSALRSQPELGASLPPALWSERDPVFAALQDMLVAARTSDPSALLEVALQRWPEDRRCWNYDGWFALAAGEPARAAASFEQARVRSGSLPTTQREPRLGLAVLDQLRDPDSGALAAFFAADPGAGPLLAHRLGTAWRPELAALLAFVPPEEDPARGRRGD